MARLREATPSNRDASQQIQRQLLWKIKGHANGAGLALKLAQGAAPLTVLAKLIEFWRKHRVIDSLCLELAGAAILGGMTAAEVSAATGISTATLTRRVPRTLTGLRGRHLVRDAAAEWGWREA
ncbi:hypothetical protein BKG79_22280 [Mycobacteroides chelonae]|uniref:hypothetical protein n=1 Tax=Mycobacteroides chelonae TaxID=1774 RepID=UPI000911B86A|nr:hypothetical protein [Mycobacteroides chelonae]OHU33336.1 hypothetical protein BKG79_22280 [Mycobacteroides chelonae]